MDLNAINVGGRFRAETFSSFSHKTSRCFSTLDLFCEINERFGICEEKEINRRRRSNDDVFGGRTAVSPRRIFPPDSALFDASFSKKVTLFTENIPSSHTRRRMMDRYNRQSHCKKSVWAKKIHSSCSGNSNFGNDLHTIYCEYSVKWCFAPWKQVYLRALIKITANHFPMKTVVRYQKQPL